MKLTIKLLGLEQMIKNTTQKQQQSRMGVLKGLNDSTLDLQRRSQAICPLDEGTLQASAYSKLATISKLFTETGYNTKYALRQHENMKFRHRNGRKAKYLSGPMLQRKNIYIQYIADSIREAIK